MSNTPTSITVKTNLRAPKPNETPDKLLRCQASIVGKPTFDGKCAVTLTNAEKRALYKAVFKQLLNGSCPPTLGSESDKILLSLARKDAPTANEYSYDVVLEIYEGLPKLPDAINDLDRISGVSKSLGHSEDGVGVEAPSFEPSGKFAGDKSVDPTRRHRTWVIPKVEAEKDWKLAFKSAAIRDHGNNGFCHVRVKVTASQVTLNEILDTGLVGVGVKSTSGITLSQLQDQLQRLSVQTRVAPVSLELKQDDRYLRGVKVVSLSHHKVRVGPHGDLLVAEQPQAVLALEAEPWTLTDFVTHHFSGQFHILRDIELAKKMTSMLKGIQVKIKTRKTNETKDIAGFVVEDTLDNRHSAWVGKRDARERLDLPLANVGVSGKQLLLPFEMCLILPNQGLRGDIGTSMKCHVEKIGKLNSPLALSDECESVKGHFIQHQKPTPVNNRLDQAWGGSPPKVLYVEAGPRVPNFNEWTKLRKEIGDIATKVLQTTGGATQPVAATQSVDATESKEKDHLFFEVAKGSTKTDLCWDDMKAFIRRHQSSDKDPKPFIVLSTQAELSSEIRDEIKSRCDIIWGLRTIGLSQETQSSKGHMSPLEFTRQTASNILSRMQMQNPSLPDGKTVVDHLVVALHVSPVPIRATSTHPAVEHYMVTLVCKDRTANHYQTEIGLYSLKQFIDLEFVELFNKLKPRFENGNLKTVTLLRSGFGADGHDITSKAFDGKVNEISGSESGKGSKDGSGQLNKQNEWLKKEFGEIKKAFKPLPAKDTTPITVTEDSLVELRIDALDPFIRPKDDEKATHALMFTGDRSYVNNDVKSVRVQHLQKNWGIDKVTTAGVVNATIHRKPKEVEQPNSGKSSQSGDQSSLVTVADMELLAAAWSDDWLHLYDTKMPVLTYLAEKARERGMKHLRHDEDGFNNIATTPVNLPPVHYNIRDTLYYL